MHTIFMTTENHTKKYVMNHLHQVFYARLTSAERVDFLLLPIFCCCAQPTNQQASERPCSNSKKTTPRTNSKTKTHTPSACSNGKQKHPRPPSRTNSKKNHLPPTAKAKKENLPASE